MTIDPELFELLCHLEAELVSSEVWRSRAELEARLCPDFIEINPGGVLDREGARLPALSTARVLDRAGAIQVSEGVSQGLVGGDPRVRRRVRQGVRTDPDPAPGHLRRSLTQD